jgi:hypothetical protein
MAKSSPAAKPAKALKTFQGKSTKLGGGGKFAKGVADIEAKGTPPAEASAIMANAGRAKLGAAKFQKLAVAGKKRAAKSGK